MDHDGGANIFGAPRGPPQPIPLAAISPPLPWRGTFGNGPWAQCAAPKSTRSGRRTPGQAIHRLEANTEPALILSLPEKPASYIVANAAAMTPGAASVTGAQRL